MLLAARVTVHINVGRAFLYCLPTVNHSASVLNFQVPSNYVIGQMYSRDLSVQRGKGESSPFLGELALPDV